MSGFPGSFKAVHFMRKEFLARIGIFFLLAILVVSSFVIRLDNFKNSTLFSIDEIVYYRLGKQLKNDFPAYHTIEYAKQLTAEGRRNLPGYFTAPLFKHPPLFPLMVAGALKIFGERPVFAEYVSLLSGVLLIPLTYLLGASFFSRKVGILAAVFICLDPVNIITSQKVWMDTTLAFFIVLSVFFFGAGVKDRKSLLFILSGVASGLAVLTKYPGILATGIIVLYAVIYERNLFKNRMFLVGLLVPFIMLIPWGWWNYSVYGIQFLSKQESLHENMRLLQRLIAGCIGTGLVALVFYPLLKIGKKNFCKAACFQNDGLREKIGVSLRFIFCLLFFMLIKEKMLLSFDFWHLPRTSWAAGSFKNETFFYFGRLIEFSLLYFPAFLAFFWDKTLRDKPRLLLPLAAVVILLFFTIWRNFQCRYILAATPFLMILAANFLWNLLGMLLEIKGFLARNILRTGIFFFILYALLKVLYMNIAVSFPNDMCYY